MVEQNSPWAPEVIKALFQEIRKETATGMFANCSISGVREEDHGDGVLCTVIFLKISSAGSPARRPYTHDYIKGMLDRNDYLKAKQVFYEFMRNQKDD